MFYMFPHSHNSPVRNVLPHFTDEGRHSEKRRKLLKATQPEDRSVSTQNSGPLHRALLCSQSRKRCVVSESPYRVKIYCKIPCPVDMKGVALATTPYYASVHFIWKICWLSFTSNSQNVSPWWTNSRVGVYEMQFDDDCGNTCFPANKPDLGPVSARQDWQLPKQVMTGGQGRCYYKLTGETIGQERVIRCLRHMLKYTFKSSNITDWNRPSEK